MRLVICGSRTITSGTTVFACIDSARLRATTVLSGMARGVDRLAIRWAREHNIPVERFHADWPRHGRVAGMLRNALMVDSADALLAIWDGVSPGTRHAINFAKRFGKPVEVFTLAGECVTLHDTHHMDTLCPTED